MKKFTLLLPLLVLVSCTAAGPDAPALVFPEDNTSLINLPFEWRSVDKATGYLFEIGSEPTFSGIIISSESADTFYYLTTAQHTLFQTGVTYYWHVYSMSGETLGKESSVRKFTISGGKP
jgi:hypothetical protein